MAAIGLVAVFLVSAGAQGASHAALAAPYDFYKYGWTGTINEKDEYHAVVRDGSETQYNFTLPLSLRVAENGEAEVVGAYQGDQVRTERYACFPVGAAAFSTTLITEQKSSGTIDTKERVTVTTDRPDHYLVSFEVPFIKTQVTETQTQDPACPGFGTKTRTFESTNAYFSAERNVPLPLPEPDVAKLAGTWQDPKPQQKGETTTVTVKLQGCGELLGGQWPNRFPADNRLSALKEPFQQHVRAFIAALRKAGAKVEIIQVFRPDPRAFLMHHAWRVAYGRGNGQYAHEEPANVPEYTKEKIPICWIARDSDGNYSRELSIQLAQDMVATYGIYVAHGSAYPTNHSSRLAIDMNISWSGPLKIKEATEPPFNGAVVEVKQKGPYTLGNPPKTRYDQDMNPDLWKVGRSYGVIKYVNNGTPDPPHWSSNGG